MDLNNINNPNANNGLITKIWGPSGWEFLHSVTFGYPIEPSDEQKEKYKKFFELVGDVLPCKYCRISYQKFITDDDTKLTNDIMKNRSTLTKWFYDIHNKVNDKLGVNYGITFDDVVKKYESYRASCTNKKEKGCTNPLYKKAKSYRNSYIKDSPIIPYNLALQYVNYAKMRGIDNRNFQYFKKLKSENDLSKMINNKCCNFWSKRNYECNNIIKKMRISQTPSLEQEGRWRGLPTQDELKLILRFSSNLSSNELLNAVKNLPKINYKLIK